MVTRGKRNREQVPDDEANVRAEGKLQAMRTEVALLRSVGRWSAREAIALDRCEDLW